MTATPGAREAASFARRIQANIQAGQTLAAECYRDPDYFQLELEQVLRPGEAFT